MFNYTPFASLQVILNSVPPFHTELFYDCSSNSPLNEHAGFDVKGKNLMLQN